ncbi:MAG: prepilin peptidase [Pirellulales bacterium]|nr:prepilin peptidase [Pirellulales bacterium]
MAPTFWQSLALFLGGACLGAVINLGIYRLAYFRRRISPWGRTRDMPLKRSWFDRIPIVGWWALRREARFHGKGFWVRPMLVELGFALGLVALYWWELERFAINYWPQPNAHPRDAASLWAIHGQFSVHVVLLVLMAIATFIDIDEQTIPDSITVPGTIAGLLIAASGRMPVVPALWIDFNHPQSRDLTAPLAFDWPFQTTAFLGCGYSLAVAVACFWLWCFALLPRRWRRGVRMSIAWRVLWRRIAARPDWHWVLPIAVVGCLVISVVWARGGEAWRQLVSSLFGMAVGGGMIWFVRVVGGGVLQREAMGFGDVTLMAMIGAFLGWQAVVICFFVAAILAFVVAGVQWLMRGENMIPYGPFLCLGALLLILFWPPIWNLFGPYYEVPWLIPSVLGLSLPCLALLLYGLKAMRQVISIISR